MANDELRSILREELGVVLVVVRNEMESFKGEMREEMGSLRSETREEMGSFKDEMRKEVATVVQESETRMTEYIHERLLPIHNRLVTSEARQIAMQKYIVEMKGDLVNVGRKVDQCTQVLDETTAKIADMQQSMFNLENKVDTYQIAIKREILRIDTAIQSLVQQMIEMNRRLKDHIATPWNKAHPDPNSAA